MVEECERAAADPECQSVVMDLTQVTRTHPDGVRRLAFFEVRRTLQKTLEQATAWCCAVACEHRHPRPSVERSARGLPQGHRAPRTSTSTGDLPRMQSLYRVRITADDVVIASERGCDLLDYVLGDLPPGGRA